VAAIINGRRRVLRIVGIALSPEYIYTIRPASSSRTTGGSESCGWSESLASAFNMENGFNDAALQLMPGLRAPRSLRASTGCWRLTAAWARFPVPAVLALDPR